MSVGVGIQSYQKFEKPIADPYWSLHGATGPGADPASLYNAAAFAEAMSYASQALAAAVWTMGANWSWGPGCIGTDAPASTAISRVLTGLLATTLYEISIPVHLIAGSLQIAIGGVNQGAAITTKGAAVRQWTTVGAAPTLALTGAAFVGQIGPIEVRRIGNDVFAAFMVAGAGATT